MTGSAKRSLSVSGFDHDNNGVFVQHQGTFADRWFLTSAGARVDSKEGYNTFFQPETLGRRFRHSPSIG